MLLGGQITQIVTSFFSSFRALGTVAFPLFPSVSLNFTSLSLVYFLSISRVLLNSMKKRKEVKLQKSRVLSMHSRRKT